MVKRGAKQFDYEKFGKSLATLADLHTNKKELYKTAFIRGIYSGLGGVIGATIVVALLLAVLSLFKQIPFVGPITESIRSTVDSAQ